MQTKWRQGSSPNIMFYHVAHVCIKQNAREWKAAFYTTWNQKYPVKNDRLQLSDRQHQLSTDLLSLLHKAYLIHTIFPINNFTKSQPYPPLSSEHVGCHNRGAQIFSRRDKLTVYAYASTTMHCPPHVPCASHEAFTSPPSHKSNNGLERQMPLDDNIQLSHTQNGNHQQPGFNDWGQQAIFKPNLFTCTWMISKHRFMHQETLLPLPMYEDSR